MLDYLEENLTCPECKKKTLNKELIEYMDEFEEEDGSTWTDFSYSYYYECNSCGYSYETDAEDEDNYLFDIKGGC